MTPLDLTELLEAALSTPPNKERVELFLAALESGKYVQCSGSLRAQNLFGSGQPWRYCALGVATKVALDNGLRESLNNWVEDDILYESGVLEPLVADWYGFNSLDPILAKDEDGNWDSVSSFNDDEKDFWWIAQAGRARWLKDQGSDG
jgi:hypothetical protein